MCFPAAQFLEEIMNEIIFIDKQKKLKPCPFHKDKREFAPIRIVKDYRRDCLPYFAECSSCGARGGQSKTAAEAKRSWNKRA